MERRILLKDFLAREVKPALGCTEPGAVALAVARACEELPDKEYIASVRVTVSGSIYKNGMAVGIPGTRGARGNAIAAALGAICGVSALGLEVLRESGEADVARAAKWVDEGRSSIYCDPDRAGVYVLATVFTPSHKAVCLVEKSHSHIARVVLDGQTTYEAPSDGLHDVSASGFEDDGFPEKLHSALALVDEMDAGDEAFLLRGAEMNMAVADAGYKSSQACAACGECVQGSRFGRTFLEMSVGSGGSADPEKRDVAMQIRSVCAAASDARMSGVLMPVMSSAGSGNHGITAILPVWILGRRTGRTDREIARAIAVSHIATSFVKRRMGRLSPACGCAIAAGSGVAAGMASLLGGGQEEIDCAMSLVLSNLAGMLCDGAKESCALKVGTAAAEAYYAAKLAQAGQRLCVPQGIFGDTVEETAANVGMVTTKGMKTVDNIVIEILDERHRIL